MTAIRSSNGNPFNLEGCANSEFPARDDGWCSHQFIILSHRESRTSPTIFIQHIDTATCTIPTTYNLFESCQYLKLELEQQRLLMEFQPTPGTYAPVDPFKPSISFGIKRILGSQRALREDTDLNSPPPPRVTISARRHGAIRPPTDTAVGPRYATPADGWIPTRLSGIRLPPPHELRAPRSELPPDNWIPQASDSPIRLPPPHDLQHVQGDSHSHWSNRPPAARMDTTFTNSRQPNTSHYQNSEFRSRRRSRSSSPSDRSRGRHRPRSPPLSVRDSSPRIGSSRANEQLRQKRNFRSRHQSRSPLPSVERDRERSPSQRRRRSRSRSRSPVRSRRSRSTRRSSSSSSPSAVGAPMVLYYGPPRLIATIPPPPTTILPPSGVPVLVPPPSSLPSPIVIQPSSLRSSSNSRRSRSARARSRTPIIPLHSPVLIPIVTPQSPLSSLSTESGDEYRLPLPPTRNSTSQPPLPEPDFPTSYPLVSSTPSAIVKENEVPDYGAVLPPRHYEYPLSPVHEKTDADASVSSRRSAVSESFDERRPMGQWDPPESVHLMTYVAAFALDTLPRQLYLHFLLRLPYMYYSRVTRIFEEAEMSMPQIKQGILEAAIQLKEPVKDVADAWVLEPVESAQYSKLQNTWQSFIDSLMREWKTLNIISVLLLS
jgi:hypothetical protein